MRRCVATCQADLAETTASAVKSRDVVEIRIVGRLGCSSVVSTSLLLRRRPALPSRAGGPSSPGPKGRPEPRSGHPLKSIGNTVNRRFCERHFVPRGPDPVHVHRTSHHHPRIVFLGGAT